jgi:ubiquinone/menaquinone biosynthesis C-methylase UbiE
MPPSPPDSAPFDYLRVDEFMRGIVEAQALKTALDLKVIDRLRDRREVSAQQLEAELRLDGRGLGLLLDLLQANGVIERDGAALSLHPRFREALRYRDLLEAKLDFAALVAGDVLHSFTALVNDPAGFMLQSRIFDLFNYQHSLQASEENQRRVQAWMRFTTILTRYEAQACLARHRFDAQRRLLDIGGNSGEFALQLCRAHPQLQAAVFDLPVVCAVGRENVAGHPEASRITFIPGNALNDPLPAGFDLVTFKSTLHDWPEKEAKRLLTRASQALAPGGTLLIFERGPLQAAETGVPYGLIPMLLFFRSFRAPEVYQKHLEAVGFTDVGVEWLPLEMPFFLLTARLAVR